MLHSRYYCSVLQRLQDMSDSSKRGRYSCKTLSDKYEALKTIERGIAKKDIAALYNVPPNTLSMDKK